MGKQGWCIWITGLPGSGKSTVSAALMQLLKKKKIQAQLLSSDALRAIMTPKPSYALEERDTVYATLVHIARLLTQNGVNVVIDATGNLRRYRQNAREDMPSFIEVYLECPLKVCMQRETRRTSRHHAPAQIYMKAEKGEPSTVPGVGQPYEPPQKAEVTLDTTACSPTECAEQILKRALLPQKRRKGKS